jgi:hypothetical protein
MKDAKQLLVEFLDLIETTTTGNQVQFSVDYQKDEIIITKAPSGFLRFLYQNNKFCAHLRPEGLKVQLFK